MLYLWQFCQSTPIERKLLTSLLQNPEILRENFDLSVSREKRSPYPNGYDGLPANFEGQIQWKDDRGRISRRDTYKFAVRIPYFV